MHVVSTPILLDFARDATDRRRKIEGETRFRDGHHRMNDRVVGVCIAGRIGVTTMKTFLAGVALAIAVASVSQAFALPYCPNGMWKHGHYVCTTYDQ